MDKMALAINSIACGLIALRLMCYSRNGAQHNPLMSVIAYLMIVTTGSVPIHTIFGDYPQHDISEAVLNTVLCVAVFVVKGNVAQLFWRLRHE